MQVPCGIAGQSVCDMLKSFEVAFAPAEVCKPLAPFSNIPPEIIRILIPPHNEKHLL